MKREDGHLLQKFSRQELRVHEVTHGGAPAIKLVQWRDHSYTGEPARWDRGAFDGVVTATAQRELLAYLIRADLALPTSRIGQPGRPR